MNAHEALCCAGKQVWYLSFLTPLLGKYIYSVIQLCSKKTAKDMAFNLTTLKLKNRDCAYKLKYGLPKLREVLRQVIIFRCQFFGAATRRAEVFLVFLHNVHAYINYNKLIT
jgi:hypothetical protein